MRAKRVLANTLTFVGILILVIVGIKISPYIQSRKSSNKTEEVRENTAETMTLKVSVTAPATEKPLRTETSTVTPTLTIARPTPEPTSTPKPLPPTRIVIPKIGVDAPVVAAHFDTETSSWEVPDFRAAGWHEGSATLETGKNTVLNGHNTTKGEIFRDLYQLEEGDQIILYSEQYGKIYKVQDVHILLEYGQTDEVRQKNARFLGDFENERLTLVTCHPYGSLRNRLVVVAFPQTLQEKEFK